MENALKRRIAGGAAGLALLAGAGGAAFAATSNDPGRSAASDRDAFLAGVAKRLNVSPTALKDAIAAEAKARGGIPPLGPPGPGPGWGFGGDDFHGHDFHGGPPPPFAGPPPPGQPPRPLGPPGPPPPVRAGLDAAAKYLGLTGARLRKQLESGKSLADVAAARGKSIDGLKSAIEAAVKAELDKAVADRRLTQAEEDHILSDLHDRLDELVNRKLQRWRHP